MTKASRDFQAEFAQQKPLTKKEIYRLQPGTWIELRWLDGPNTVALLEERVTPGRGDRTLLTLDVENGMLVSGRSHATHDQIVDTHGQINVVAPTPSRV